jgi:ketosteroid isomerase-like protein
MLRISCFLLLVFPAMAQESNTFQCQLEQFNREWQEALTTKDAKKIYAHYFDTGIFLMDDVWTTGKLEIGARLAELKLAPTEIKTLDVVFNRRKANYIEMATFKHKDQKMLSVTGWRFDMGKWIREIQMLYPIDTEKPENPQEIHEARRLWVKNATNAKVRELMDTSYTADTIYYSQGQITKGRDDLYKAYSYMESPDYSVDLSGVRMVPLGPKLVAEIGFYMANGGLGPYFLLWQKDKTWQAAVDFNF